MRARWEAVLTLLILALLAAAGCYGLAFTTGSCDDLGGHLEARIVPYVHKECVVP